MATIIPTAPVPTPSELRTVALSRIVVPDSFNPRGEVGEDAELLALAESMRQHGCLQPVRLRPTAAATTCSSPASDATSPH